MLKPIRPLFAALGLAVSLVASEPAAPMAPVRHGVDPTLMNAGVKPCEDFFEFADGAWLKRTQIPGEYSSWGAFSEIYVHNQEVIHGLLEDAAKETEASGPRRIVGDFFASGMDEAGIEKAGLKPLAPEFARVRSMKSRQDLIAELAHLHGQGIRPGFGFFVGVDDKRATVNIPQLVQGGLGLPERDYYTKDDDASKDLRAKYVAHVAKMFELAGDRPAAAKAHAGEVMALETRLAKASMTLVEQRDPNAVYHRMSAADLQASTPDFVWASYFKGLGLAKVDEVLVRQPGFFKAFSKAVAEVPMGEWKTYCRWFLLKDLAGDLGKEFVNEDFAFNGQILQGKKELSARWKRVQENMEGGYATGILGEAMGRLYVEKTFPPESKARMLAMVKNLQAALRERIKGLEWMSEATKAQALHKLDAFGIKIGYPDTWRSTEGLEVKRDSYVLNDLRVARFNVRFNLSKLGKPVDKSEWGMGPQIVNAQYEPTANDITFPAGILQPPFFDPAADDAVNYGAIGMVIGHEMTHGFDDQGRQYDADGNLKDWWTEADAKAYNERAQKVVAQFDGYSPLEGLHINGKLTLGENIADLGGLKIAYAAWLKSLGGQEAPVMDGITGPQRFFLGYAQSWRFLARPEAAKLRLNTDPHSPAKYRVIGPLSNLPEFHQAFACGDGNAMIRPETDRAAIW